MRSTCAIGSPPLVFRRALPGHPRAVYVAESNEHDPAGALDEEVENHIAMVEKRQGKLRGMVGEMSGPARYGPAEAETTFICWGSTYGPLREAVDLLNAERPGRANMLHFTDLWPLPLEPVMAALASARLRIAVEVNATAQLANLLRSQTGIQMDSTILKYDGRPFTPEYILAHVLKPSLIPSQGEGE